MRFELEIDSIDAAFTGTDDELYAELRRILGVVSGKLGQHRAHALIHDINGNRVGRYDVTYEEDTK